MGDIDLWAVSDDGGELTVNPRWLEHLQARVLGEDGHPRKVRAEDGDAGGCGLVLEWVYG